MLDLKIKAEEIRKLIIDVVSENGGHLAPNLGVVELTIALHQVFDFSKDIILFDVGHQTYVHKILTGRKDKFNTLRKRHGISPFMDPDESYYDPFISGHAGTALPVAVGFALANPDKKVVVVVGDASIVNGHSLEAINYIGDKKIKNIILVMNNNDMSIAKNIGSFTKLYEKLLSVGNSTIINEIKNLINRLKGSKNDIDNIDNSFKKYLLNLNLIEYLGFRYFGSVDGHNIEELIKRFEIIKREDGPIFINVNTVKGKGYSFAEENKEKFHGVSPFNKESGEIMVKNTIYSDIFSEKIAELGKDEDIYVLSAGMIKGTGLAKFKELYQERAIDVGIAEGFLVSFAAGLAKASKKPYVCLYSTFLQRAVSQLIHDVSILNLPVRFIIDRCGISGEDGKTHNGMYDTQFFLSIKNFNVINIATKEELQDALEISKNFYYPLVIRYPKDIAYSLPSDGFYNKNYKLQLGKWNEIKKGEKTIFIATGSMLKEIVEINDELLKRGINATIVSAASIKPFDEEYLLNEVTEYDNIFILEECYSKNSFSSSVVNFLNDNFINKNIFKINLQDTIIPHGKRSELLEEYGLKGYTLIERIEDFIYGGKKSKG